MPATTLQCRGKRSVGGRSAASRRSRQLGSRSTIRTAPTGYRAKSRTTRAVIDEASKLYADALVHNQAEVSALVEV